MNMREIKTGLEDKDVKVIIHNLLVLKEGMDKAASLPADVRTAAINKSPTDLGRASPALSMAIAAGMLETHERELRKRGIDPKQFGFDWLGLIKEVHDE